MRLFIFPIYTCRWYTSSGEVAVKEQSIQGGVDFSAAKRNPDGRLCVIQEKMVETVAKDPVMKCITKNVEICPFSYNVQFEPVQEEVGTKNLRDMIRAHG